MSRLHRDLGIAGAIAAGFLVSLVLARLLTTDPTPTADQTARSPSAAGDWPTPDPTISSTLVTPPSAAAMSAAAAAPPAATMVLSSGVQVVPRLGRPPQSYRPAPAVLPTTTPPPPDTPDPAVSTDPAALGTAWLAAMCWYDYRTGRDDNTRRAAAFGDTSMPTGANPWALDNQAWTRITTSHLSSGCTDIVALPAHTGYDGPDQDTVTLTATQLLMSDGSPYQAVPISLTRALHHGPEGQWLIGPAVTAN